MEIESARKFMSFMTIDPNHRFCSWEYCYKTFGDNPKINDEYYIDTLSLHLSFYLASWGMYRGSSGLLWKDYKVHIEAIKYILKNYELRDDSKLDENYFKKVHTVFLGLKKIYGEIEFSKTKKGEIEKGNISPTDTLISKILLGTLGCMPAFDSFVVKSSGIRLSKGEGEFSKQLFNMVEAFNKPGGVGEHKSEFHHGGVQYPTMKIIDMCYWQSGADGDQNTKVQPEKL